MTVTQHEEEKLGSELPPLLDLRYKLHLPWTCIHFSISVYHYLWVWFLFYQTIIIL